MKRRSSANSVISWGLVSTTGPHGGGMAGRADAWGFLGREVIHQASTRWQGSPELVVTLEYDITGGTGRFDGATGHVDMVTRVQLADPLRTLSINRGRHDLCRGIEEVIQSSIDPPCQEAPDRSERPGASGSGCLRQQRS